MFEDVDVSSVCCEHPDGVIGCDAPAHEEVDGVDAPFVTGRRHDPGFAPVRIHLRVARVRKRGSQKRTTLNKKHAPFARVGSPESFLARFLLTV